MSSSGRVVRNPVLGRSGVGFIGDSITQRNDSYNAPLKWGAENNGSPALWAMLQSRGNWELIQNAGIGGQTSAQILARLQNDILSIPAIDICVILSCTWNDIGHGFTLSQSVANVTTMIQQCLTAGVLPVVCTPTPNGQTGSTSAQRNGAAQRRREFIQLGRQYNIPVVDLFQATLDITTGNIANAYNADGSVHCNPAGVKAMGQVMATFLDNLCSGTAITDIGYAGDTDDLLLGNGFMLGVPAGGIAGGWSNSGMAAGATPSIYSDPTLGVMQRITTAATVGNSFIVATFNVIAGHMYEISGFMNKTGTSYAQVSMNGGTGNRRVTVLGTDPDITNGRFNVRAVGNANETITTYLGVGAGTGTCDFGRLTVRDLTALGIS